MDHLNLLYKKLSGQRMNRWQQLLEEYGPEIKHVPGEKNVVADTLCTILKSRPKEESVWIIKL